MQFILKLFKALNSAQSPWQVTLAITLGMVAGLTPMSGIQTIVVLFLAFVLNIHLGLFFVSSALFAGIAYLFDPWFEQIGYALLVNEGLQGYPGERARPCRCDQYPQGNDGRPPQLSI